MDPAQAVPPQQIRYWPIAVVCLLGLVLFFFPVLDDVPANNALIILLTAAILWMTEAIPLSATSLIIPVLAILFGILPATDAFSQFGNPVIFLFMGGFVLAGALSIHHLDQLLAQRLIRLAKRNFYWSAVLLMLCTSLLACWISNTSSTAMIIPLGLGLLTVAGKKTNTAEAKFLMLGIAYSANIGGIITMISTPPNALGAAILKLSFSEWLKYSLPVFFITFPIMVIILTLFCKPDRKLSIDEITSETLVITHKKRLMFIFLFTVVLWMLDGSIAPMLNIESGFNSVVAIIAILLLFTFKVMDWNQILKSIHWDILLLFGGGLTLGLLVEESGLGLILIEGVMTFSEQIPMFLFLWLIVLFSIILTEFMSNTASAALILPLLYTLAIQSGINPLLLVLPATIAASFGFMMPVGTPPNAMVFSLGFIAQREMMKVGLLLNLIFSVILAAFFYLLLL